MRSIAGWRRIGGRIGGAAMALGLAVLPLAAQARGLVITGLSFTGNKSIPGEVLAASIGTTNSDWTTRAPILRSLNIGEERTFSQQQFRNDVFALGVLYRSYGFPDARIDTTVRRREGEVDIEFRITEGEPIRVGQVTIAGADQVGDRFRVVRDLPIASGDVFNRWVGRAAGDTLTSRLRARGYPLATTTFTWDSTDRYRADLRFEMVTGPHAVFGPIAVTGFRDVDSAFIASLLTLRPGQDYRDEELYRSQRALAATQLFSYARVSIDTSRFPGADSSVVPLRVEVQEGKMYATRASAGWASTDCYRAGAGWTARNLLGGGRALDLSGQLSKIGVGDPLDFGACRSLYDDDPIGSRQVNYSLEAAVRQNTFFSPDNALTVSVFRQRTSEFKVYNRQETGGALAVTRETYARIPVTLSYRVSYGRTDAAAATFCGYFNSCTASDIDRLRQSRTLAVLSLAGSRTRVNNPLDPTRGSALSAEMNVASRYLGSSREQQFVRISGDATGYLPLSRSVVLAAHVRGGFIMAPRVALEQGRESFIPPEHRFYAGGPNDVRGFNRNELGPVVYVIPREALRPDSLPPYDEGKIKASPLGGDRVVGLSAEVRTPFPVFPSLLRFAAFVDMGALHARGSGDSPLRITPGVGLRVVLPRFAPVRFDVAYNPYPSQRGALYSDTEAGDLVLVREDYARARADGFFRRLTFHIAFGHAY